MNFSASTGSTLTGSRATLGLAAASATAVIALIPLTAVVGEWWLLGVTFAMLMATAGLVVLGLFGLLAQTGEPVAATAARATGARRATPSGASRRRRVPVLRSA